MSSLLLYLHIIIIIMVSINCIVESKFYILINGVSVYDFNLETTVTWQEQKSLGGEINWQLWLGFINLYS